MKQSTYSVAFLLILLLGASGFAQERVSAIQNADKLRLELLELQSREEMLRLRAEYLEHELKPENIERALAGIGSTKPEDLREARRRRLSIERESVLTQLEIVQKRRSSLEVEIAGANVRAYQESAAPTPMPGGQNLAIWSKVPALPTVITAFSSLVLITVGSIGCFFFLMRRRV